MQLVSYNKKKTFQGNEQLKYRNDNGNRDKMIISINKAHYQRM